MSKNAPRWVLGELDSGDPDEPYRRLLFSPVLDAICKSIMTNDPESTRVLGSPSAMSDMIESRVFLSDPGAGEGTINYYLSALSIDPGSLIVTLRHLWRRQEKDMTSTIRKHMKPVRGTGKRRIQPSRTSKLAHRAMDVLKQSNRWVGV